MVSTSVCGSELIDSSAASRAVISATAREPAPSAAAFTPFAIDSTETRMNVVPAAPASDTIIAPSRVGKSRRCTPTIAENCRMNELIRRLLAREVECEADAAHLHGRHGGNRRDQRSCEQCAQPKRVRRDHAAKWHLKV